jgi:hypothetical protein
MTIVEAIPGFRDRVFHILNTGTAGDEARFEGLTIRNGDVLNTDNGGGIFNANASRLAVVSSTLSNNRASHGGAIVNEGGTARLENSNLEQNQASNQGGGIFNGGGQMTISTTTLDNNLADNGSGIYSNGTLTMTNSTLSQNQALAAFGGGIYNDGPSTSVAVLTNTTLAQNEAAVNGAGLYNDGGAVTLINTIVAENTPGGDCFNNSGSITDAGYNLDSDATCSLAPPSIPAGNANLSPLQNNGGSTQTHALLDGSQAIDAGNNNVCPATDQRGEPRPQDGDESGAPICDIGAYERATIYKGYLPFISSDGN